MINFKNHQISGTLDEIKNAFKNILSKESWIEMEENGVPLTIDGTKKIMIVGSKWGRVAMHSNILTMKKNATIMWKFKFHEWLEVSTQDLYAMHDVCNRFIADNARWEYIVNINIDNANSEEELQCIADNAKFIPKKQYSIKNGEVYEL